MYNKGIIMKHVLTRERDLEKEACIILDLSILNYSQLARMYQVQNYKVKLFYKVRV